MTMTTTAIPRLLDVTCAASAPLPAQTPMEAAYQRVRDEIAAVPDADLVAINVDVPSTVSMVKTAVPALMALRPSIESVLPSHDLASFDKLADYADALAFVQTRFKRDDEPPGALPSMYAEGLAFRESVVAVGRVLVSLQLIDSRLFASSGRVIGYRNVGYELISLCTALLEKWPQLAGRCPLSEEQLVRGKTLGNMLIDGVVERSVDAGRSNSAQKERQRAYTLLTRAYDEARRAVAYLRWHDDDAERIAPSIFAGRGAGRRSVESQQPDDAAASERDPATAPASAPTSPQPQSAGAPASPVRPAGDPLFTAPSDEPFETA